LPDEFGVSIAPVGEALRVLEREELVESRPRVGARVRIPTAEDVRGHYVVREALETHSARLFVDKASPAEREEIRLLGEWLDEAYGRAGQGGLSKEEVYEIHQKHVRFHMRVTECTGFRALKDAMNRNHVLTMNWLCDTVADWHKFPVRFHGDLADALSFGNVLQASEAMRAHVTYGKDQLLEKLEQHLRTLAH